MRILCHHPLHSQEAQGLGPQGNQVEVVEDNKATVMSFLSAIIRIIPERIILVERLTMKLAEGALKSHKSGYENQK